MRKLFAFVTALWLAAGPGLPPMVGPAAAQQQNRFFHDFVVQSPDATAPYASGDYLPLVRAGTTYRVPGSVLLNPGVSDRVTLNGHTLALGSSLTLGTTDVVTSSSISNAMLQNSGITLNGHSLSLGGSLSLAPDDIGALAKDGSNVTLPAAQESLAIIGGAGITTSNTAGLNNGTKLISGYTGTIDNSTQLRWLNETLYGTESCSDQMFKIFNPIRGFAALQGICGTIPSGTAVSQFIPGLFSIDDFAGANNAIPLVAQSIAEVSNAAEWGINTVHLDAARKGYSSAASISGTALTPGGTTSGTFGVGDYITGSGVTAGTKITVDNGDGTYTVNNSQSVGPVAVSSSVGSLSGITLQDEVDFFALNNDTRSRFLIDGYFPNGASSLAHQRQGVLVSVFSGSNGHWQEGYVSGNGAADAALLVGSTTSGNPASTGNVSQLLEFAYTDNTTANVQRYLTLKADPTNAGSTGADLLLGGSYTAPANLVVSNGNITTNGNITAQSTVAATISTFSTTIDNTNDSELWFEKARGGVSGPTAVSTNDDLGTIRFKGYDGSAYVDGAFITAKATGTIGAGNVGGKLTIGVSGASLVVIDDTTGVSVAGNPIADTSGNAVHQMMISRNGSVTGNATTNGCVTGNCTANATANAVYMPINQTGKFSDLHVTLGSDPGNGNTTTVTLLDNSGATLLSCVVTGSAGGTNKTCTDTNHRVSVSSDHVVNWQFVQSSGASTNTAYVAVSFDNPSQ